jgi:hypothetical protein
LYIIGITRCNSCYTKLMSDAAGINKYADKTTTIAIPYYQ